MPCMMDNRASESRFEDSQLWLFMQGDNRAEVQAQHDHEVAAFKRLLELGEKSYKEYEPDNAYTCRLTMEVGMQPFVHCSHSSATLQATIHLLIPQWASLAPCSDIALCLHRFSGSQ